MSGADLTPDRECAERLDTADPLAGFRDRFSIPNQADGSDEIYLVGNSLGAMPKRSRELVENEMRAWARLGVRGHFAGDNQWSSYHQLLIDQMSAIVGGLREEVTLMNALTVNLHLLLVSFYNPTIERHKILIEDHAFPSDHFAVESQIRQRGRDPAESLVVLTPRDGEDTLRTEDILATIAEQGDSLATIMLPGVQYYTGQVLPMLDITRAGHGVGALVGFDLAHAVGNIELDLHDWGVDFAAWCTYKYLNSGPGGVAGAFVHNRHVEDRSLPKFTGWWGTNPSTRFEMSNDFDPIPTVDSWNLSNGPILLLAGLRGSLDVIDEAGGMSALRQKSELQIQFLDLLIAERFAGRVDNVTPRSLAERGCQFSLQIVAPGVEGRNVFERLEAAGVGCDWRYPDVIRVAPVPLYNTFEDLWRFTQILDEILAP